MSLPEYKNVKRKRVAGGDGGNSLRNSTQVQQFFDRLATIPNLAMQLLYANLIDGLVSDGIWSLLDGLYVWSENSETQMTNLVQDTFWAGLTGNPTFHPYSGYDGANSSVIRLTAGLILSAGVNYTQNSAFIAAWQNGDDAPFNSDIISDGVTGIAQTYTNLYYWNVNTTGLGDSVANTHSSGFFLATRTAPNATQAFLNGVSVGTSVTASVPRTATILYILNSCPTNWRCGCWAFGGGLTAPLAAALYNRLHTYGQEIGAVF